MLLGYSPEHRLPSNVERRETWSNFADTISCLAWKFPKEVKQGSRNSSLAVASPPQLSLFTLELTTFTFSQGSPAPFPQIPLLLGAPPRSPGGRPSLCLNPITTHIAPFSTPAPPCQHPLMPTFPQKPPKIDAHTHFILYPNPISMLQPECFSNINTTVLCHSTTAIAASSCKCGLLWFTRKSGMVALTGHGVSQLHSCYPMATASKMHFFLVPHACRRPAEALLRAVFALNAQGLLPR